MKNSTDPEDKICRFSKIVQPYHIQGVSKSGRFWLVKNKVINLFKLKEKYPRDFTRIIHTILPKTALKKLMGELPDLFTDYYEPRARIETVLRPWQEDYILMQDGKWERKTKRDPSKPYIKALGNRVKIVR